MQINVTVDGLDGVDLSTVIGDEIAYSEPDTGYTERQARTLGDLVAEKLADKIYAGLDYERRHELTKTVSAERVKLIRERLIPQVEEALSGEIRKTNNYGEPTGQTTTMRELVIAEIERVVNAKGDRFHNNSEAPLITRVVTAEVNRALTNDLNKAFQAERDKVVAVVRAQAAELVAAAVKKGLGQ